MGIWRYVTIGLAAFNSAVDTLAWSPTGSQDSKDFGRRSFLNELSSIGAFCLLIEPKGAIAQEAVKVKPSNFDAYSIIPDPSASLDPKLERISVSELKQTLVDSS